MRTFGRAGRSASCGGALAAALAFGAQAESLSDAISLAYETNPTLQQERAQLRATDETYVQAESGLRPTLSVGAGYTYENAKVTEGAFSGQVTGGTGTAEITASQPLYTGGRVTAKMDAAHADILAERENLRRTEISVLQGVIGAYLDVRRDSDALGISQDNVKVLQHEVEETSARFDAGELTLTDVAQSKARLALAQSQLATAQATLAQSRAAYRAVVGQQPGELQPEPPIENLLPTDIDAAFDAAERDNPQVRQADDAEAGSAARLAEAKAQTRPTVTLNGQYGYVGEQEGVAFGSQPGLLTQELGGAVSVQATQPIFTGGLTASQIRQAAAQDDMAQFGVEAAKRAAQQATAQAWSQLLGTRANVAASQQQVTSNQTAFEGVTEEQKVGLRTVLDVLNAQQELETAQLDLVNARHDEYIAAAAVLAAIGALDAHDFAPGERLYDPNRNLDKVRHGVGWVPWEGAVGAIDRLGAPAPVDRTPPPENNVPH
ncbi:MAG TPA: TolC family outer membrane protein [Caulobacteraceae bacterium]|nr:TolC family outer membrane protein [Caulobacteraceae bacterium]